MVSKHHAHTKNPSGRRARAKQAKGYLLVLVLIVFFGILLSYSFFYGPSPINGADNFIYADDAYLAYHGNFIFVGGNTGVLSQEYALIFGIALFCLLLGAANSFTTSLFGVLCFALTLVVVYKIGSKLYGRNAGLISAFVYSFNPVAVANASYVGDNGPMALVVCACVLFLVFALKEKSDARRRRCFLLSGFFSLIGILITIQSLLVLVFALPVLLFYLLKNRNRSSLLDVACFAAGVALAIAAISLADVALGQSPLFFFIINFQKYSAPVVGHNGMLYYINALFPPGVSSNIFDAHTGWFTDGSNLSMGLFGYFCAASVLFLLLRRNFSFLIPLFWFISTLLYLGLGSMSLTHYVPITYFYVRFMLLSLPAAALIIGFAATSALELGKGKKKKYAVAFLTALAILVLFLNSLVLISYVGISQYKYVYPFLQFATQIKTLPANTLYIPEGIPFAVYVNYNYHIISLPPPSLSATNCSNFVSGVYLIARPNLTAGGGCANLRPLLTPKAPEYLASYDLFDESGFGTYYNYTLYYAS